MAGAASGQWESAWWLGRSLRIGGGAEGRQREGSGEQREGEIKRSAGNGQRERENGVKDA